MTSADAPPPLSGLFTDLYELTMAQGYLAAGQATQRATFDYFFRHNPFGGGYVIFAGIGELAQALHSLRFDEEALTYLRSTGRFSEGFLRYLSAWRFQGSVWAAREGEVVFPLAPVVRVSGDLIETQLVETLLLNQLNFQSLIATKAARIAQAAQGRPFYEFGLRRAQGEAAMQASRAAAIGGAAGTSNVLAAKRYGLSVQGTMAHSWVQSFEDELTAFRAHATHYPDHCVLLVDTYNTLHSGLPHAIQVARELEARGQRLRAVRLDSGDLAYLSKKARKQLDDAGLHEVQILATNQLDEHLIQSLLDQGAPIDAFGVGTRLVTGHDAGALDGVYKLSEVRGGPCIKLSDNFTKVNLPGRKQVYRYFDAQEQLYSDAIALEEEQAPELIHHPFFSEQRTRVGALRHERLLHEVLRDGELTAQPWSVEEASSYARAQLRRLPEEHRRFANPHTYKVGVSARLLELRSTLYEALRERAMG